MRIRRGLSIGLYCVLLLVLLSVTSCVKEVPPSPVEIFEPTYPTTSLDQLLNPTPTPKPAKSSPEDMIVEIETSPREEDFVFEPGTVTVEPGTAPAPVVVVDDPAALRVDEWLASLSPKEKIGQLLVCRLPVLTTRRDGATDQLLADFHIGGFILFSENIKTVEQTQALTAALNEDAEIPRFIAVDEEGGRVSRVGKLYADKIPEAYALGQDDGDGAVYDAYFEIGTRLKDLGFNMDFAPVADIWSNEANTVIGTRAFGRDAETAADGVDAAVRGLNAAGMLSVVKHFPGHGDTVEDSHRTMAVYEHDRARFDSTEALPFKRGIASGAAGIMAGHIVAPQIAPDALPATLSAYWLQEVLRGEWDYDGLVVTDALEMSALTNAYTGAEIAVGAFMAGADVLLIPSDPAEAHAALMEAYRDGRISDERLDASVRRILRTKDRLL